MDEPRSVHLMKEVWVGVESPFKFTEKLDPLTGSKKFILHGLMLPFNKVSRNSVLYNQESIEKKHKDLIGRPVMYNHKIEGNEYPKGHFTDSYTVNEPDDKHPIAGWYYEADIDPQEKDCIRKLQRGDLKHVSIQLVGGDVVERSGAEGMYSEAYVSDVIEGSIVPAPGFLDTSAQFIEAFRETNKLTEPTLEVGSYVKKDGKLWQIVEHLDGGKIRIQEVNGKLVEDVDGSSVEDDATQYDEPSMDGDLMVKPWTDGEEAENVEELAEGYMKQLGEKYVKELLDDNGI